MPYKKILYFGKYTPKNPLHKKKEKKKKKKEPYKQQSIFSIKQLQQAEADPEADPEWE